MYATELALTSPPQLWSFLYFTMYFVLSTISLVSCVSREFRMVVILVFRFFRYPSWTRLSLLNWKSETTTSIRKDLSAFSYSSSPFLSQLRYHMPYPERLPSLIGSVFQGGNLIAHFVEHELKIINFLVITMTFLIVFLYGIQRYDFAFTSGFVCSSNTICFRFPVIRSSRLNAHKHESTTGEIDPL